MRGGGRRRRRRRYSRIRIARVFGSETKGPSDEATDRVDLLQLAQTAQLPEEEYPKRETETCNSVQHRFWAVVRLLWLKPLLQYVNWVSVVRVRCFISFCIVIILSESCWTILEIDKSSFVYEYHSNGHLVYLLTFDSNLEPQLVVFLVTVPSWNA